MGEPQLGDTDDPTVLIPGNVGHVRATVKRLRTFGSDLYDAGAGLKRLSTPAGWRGLAAAQFESVYQDNAKQWLAAGDSFMDAGDAVDAYASTLEWAQHKAADAIELYDKAQRATARAKQAYEATQQPGVSFHDPGTEARGTARDWLRDARTQVAKAGNDAAALVRRAAKAAPNKPGVWAQVVIAGEVIWDATGTTPLRWADAAVHNPVELAEVVGGTATMLAGGVGEAGGAILDATGAGALIGVDATAAGATAVGVGQHMAGDGLNGLAMHAEDSTAGQIRPGAGIDTGGHAAEPEPGFPAPERIEGHTAHGAEQMAGRDGHGVSDAAAEDAVNNPIKPPEFRPDKYGGHYRYVGKDAVVNLNKNGEVITAWSKGRAGWRTP